MRRPEHGFGHSPPGAGVYAAKTRLPELLAAAANRHRPVAQIIRDLMRLYVADSETPNALTADARQARRCRSR